MDLLPLAWAFVIAFCIVMYVILDGFTLGAGMLMPFLTPEERDQAMSVLLPTWDGNQTWLVLGGASLLWGFSDGVQFFIAEILSTDFFNGDRAAVPGRGV